MVNRPLSLRTAAPALIALLLLGVACCLFELQDTHRTTLAFGLGAIAFSILLYSASRGMSSMQESLDVVVPASTIEPRWMSETISSAADLSRILEEIASHAYRILQADCVELSLYDGASRGFHSSIVVGIPGPEIFVDEFQESAEGSGGEKRPVQTGKSDVVQWGQDLIFAGELMGKLQVRLQKGRVLSPTEANTLRSIAMHGVMVLINARYSLELLAMRRDSDVQLKVRSGFLANLSHELRGPLGIIVNASELVLEGLCGPLTADQEETLGMVRLNSEHLMELITDVLDYAKIESGNMLPTPVVLDVNDQLLEISIMVRAQADAKRHVIRCRELPEHLLVRCDRRHFRQMLINLLTNAIKYTPDSGTIEAWAERVRGSSVVHGGGDYVRICVRDSGVGIPAKDRPKVFTAFERLDHEYSNTQVGTGLGLSLTRRLAQLNDGSVEFDSEVGFGSTFWIDLPMSTGSEVSAAAESDHGISVHASGEQILMVGPSDEERVLVSRYLKSIGYAVHLADDEKTARSILRTNPIALVVFGDGLVPSSGKPLAAFVREEQRSGHIPVVLLTRHAFLVDVERYLREDIDLCLAKPVRLDELGTTCRKAIDLTVQRIPAFQPRAKGELL